MRIFSSDAAHGSARYFSMSWSGITSSQVGRPATKASTSAGLLSNAAVASSSRLIGSTLVRSAVAARVLLRVSLSFRRIVFARSSSAARRSSPPARRKAAMASSRGGNVSKPPASSMIAAVSVRKVRAVRASTSGRMRDNHSPGSMSPMRSNLSAQTRISSALMPGSTPRS